MKSESSSGNEHCNPDIAKFSVAHRDLNVPSSCVSLAYLNWYIVKGACITSTLNTPAHYRNARNLNVVLNVCAKERTYPSLTSIV